MSAKEWREVERACSEFNREQDKRGRLLRELEVANAEFMRRSVWSPEGHRAKYALSVASARWSAFNLEIAKRGAL